MSIFGRLRGDAAPVATVEPGGSGRVVKVGAYLDVRVGREDRAAGGAAQGGEAVLAHLGLAKGDGVEFELISGAVVMRKREA